MSTILSVLSRCLRLRRSDEGAPAPVAPADDRMANIQRISELVDDLAAATAADDANGEAWSAVERATEELDRLGFAPRVDSKLAWQAAKSIPEPGFTFLQESLEGKSSAQISAELGVDEKIVRRRLVEAYRDMRLMLL